MDIRPIRTEADDKATLKEISALMESAPDPGTPAGDRLDILATLVQALEARQLPITAPDPVEAIKFRMDQSGLSVKDLEPMIGKSNRVYEVLSRTRPLTLARAHAWAYRFTSLGLAVRKLMTRIPRHGSQPMRAARLPEAGTGSAVHLAAP